MEEHGGESNERKSAQMQNSANFGIESSVVIKAPSRDVCCKAPHEARRIFYSIVTHPVAPTSAKQFIYMLNETPAAHKLVSTSDTATLGFLDVRLHGEQSPHPKLVSSSYEQPCVQDIREWHPWPLC